MAGALMAGSLAGAPMASAAPSPVGLGTATTFSVLAGTTVTNTGASVVSGDLGVSPGAAVTGFPPGQVISGTVHAADAVATQAQSDLTTAYNDAAGRTTDVTVSADLGGQTLAPGVYTAAAGLALTGTVTLDGQNDPNAVFIFQAGSTLTTASNSTVALIRGTNPCNVFWQVGSSATLGTASTFAGTIMALTSATVQTATTVAGRVLARNGAVTLDANTITRSDCPNDFAISVQPASVLPGSSVTTTVQTTVTSGSAGTVTLSASGLPPGATASFQPASVTTGGSSVMTISTAPSTPPGTYPVTITATVGSISHTTTFLLTVTANGAPGEIIPLGHPETGAGGAARHVITAPAAAAFDRPHRGGTPCPDQ